MECQKHSACSTCHGRDGREVLAEIKTSNELRRIPVIVWTTSESDVDVKKAYEFHANCYVKKPADLDEYLVVRLPG